MIRPFLRDIINNHKIQGEWKDHLSNYVISYKSEGSTDNNISNFRHWQRLLTKYSIRVKRLELVIKELKPSNFCYCGKN